MLIEFKNRFKIQDLDVECKMNFSKGQLLLLTGENGIGKSSFIQFLKLNQREFFKEKKVVFIDQFQLKPINQISYKEVENLLSPMRSGKVSCYESLKEKVAPFEDKPINDLSGGQNQMVKLALGIYLAGDIFILDEPFQYLDQANVSLLTKLIVDLKEQGKTLLIVEHRKELISELVDKSYKMINSGQLEIVEEVGKEVIESGI